MGFHGGDHLELNPKVSGTVGTFHFIACKKRSSLPRSPPAPAGLIGTHLLPRPRARPPRASITSPRDSGTVIYRDTGREHRQGGDRPQPASWERRFCCPVEYSTSLVMLNGKSRVGCSDFPSGPQAQCHAQWEPHAAPFTPAFPWETCWISGGGKPYHMLSRHPRPPDSPWTCSSAGSSAQAASSPPSQQRSPPAAAVG